MPPSARKGLRMPDIVMQGVAWEMKSPEGNGKYTMKNLRDLLREIARC